MTTAQIERFTQTNLEPGNCWQTAVACVLRVPPESLPEQTTPYYNNVLQSYLEKHHGLCWTEIYEVQIPVVRVREPGVHFMLGPTVRTSNDRPIEHVVVGLYGEVFWDPHPSRAGLISVRSWGLLAPQPGSWKASRDARRQIDPELNCACPECRKKRL